MGGTVLLPALEAMLPRGIARRLAAADVALFERVRVGSWPPFDPVLPRLSRAADHSVLWWAAAAGLGASGGRRRRAALRGMTAIGVASSLANGPVKAVFRRARPTADIPLPRRVRRVPVSPSFPSGHSASAAAFATAVAIESPWLALPIGVLAAGVAVSRVYVGVHYPGDVAAGVALGAGAALLTTKVMPRRPAVPARARPASSEAPGLPAGEGLVFVVNANAGKARRENPAEALRDALPSAKIVEFNAGDDLVEVLAGAAQHARALGIAGGDGSVNAAATVASATDLPLAVVPAGTLDHFAADLGIESVEDTAEGVVAGTAVAVDLGRVTADPDRGGERPPHRLFLNTASLGGYPEMVAMRERLEKRLGKWPALVIALVRVLRTQPPIDVEVDGQRRRLWLLFAGNGRYHPSGFAPTYRLRLDEGILDIRTVDGTAPYARTRLVLAVLTGRLGRSRVYEERTASQVHVRMLSGPVRFACDGEVAETATELTLSKDPGRLVVYRPEPR